MSVRRPSGPQQRVGLYPLGGPDGEVGVGEDEAQKGVEAVGEGFPGRVVGAVEVTVGEKRLHLSAWSGVGAFGKPLVEVYYNPFAEMAEGGLGIEGTVAVEETAVSEGIGVLGILSTDESF